MTELAVLVPVLSRPQNVAPLVESFLAGCPEDSKLCFISQAHDPTETIAVGKAADMVPADRWAWCHTERVDETSWPAKINFGVRAVVADWYLCAADDIRFTEGWWDATSKYRADHQIGVIGTNDSATGTGNPRVAAGEHTCHPLMRATYIRDYGTIDVRGLAVHPGYSHWYVDDELVWTAKSRGAWAYCRDAVIEHLHPFWKPEEIPWDETYAKGDSRKDEDAALFRDRATRLLGLQFQ